MRKSTEFPPAVFQESRPTLDELIAQFRESIRALGFSGTVDHGRDAELAALYLLENTNEILTTVQRGVARPADYARLMESADRNLRELLVRSEELFAREETQYLLVAALLKLRDRLNVERRYDESGSVFVVYDALQAWLDGQPAAERVRQACTPKPGTPNPWTRAKREGEVSA